MTTILLGFLLGVAYGLWEWNRATRAFRNREEGAIVNKGLLRDGLLFVEAGQFRNREEAMAAHSTADEGVVPTFCQDGTIFTGPRIRATGTESARVFTITDSAPGSTYRIQLANGRFIDVEVGHA